MTIVITIYLIACSSKSEIPDLEMQKNKIDENMKTSQKIPQPIDDKNWFVGVIGNAKIHARFEISNNKISGIYYYDHYKIDIRFDGFIDDTIKDMQTLFLAEQTDKNGEIFGLFREKDYIQGVWKNGKDILPLYLIKEGKNLAIPKVKGENIKAFEGCWNGKNSNYFHGSQIDIRVLSDDLIFYQLNAFNGANSGGINSFAIVTKNVAQTIFKDILAIKEKESVVFKFSVENNILKLFSNNYYYMCGAGVGFDSEYTKEKVNISTPTAQQVGIVDTKEQDDIFKRLVGSEYANFILYTSGVYYMEDVFDGKKVKSGKSMLRGLSGYCFYIISEDNIYAAICKDSTIEYFTNDKNYADKLPLPIADWTTDKKELKVNYNYKE